MIRVMDCRLLEPRPARGLAAVLRGHGSCRRQDARLLLRRESRGAQPADRHHDDRHERRPADVQQSRRVQEGHDAHRARPRRKLDRLATTARSTSSGCAPACGSTPTRCSSPTRDDERRRRRVLADAAVEGGPPLPQGVGLQLRLLPRPRHAGTAQVHREGRRPDGPYHAHEARGAVPRRSCHAVQRGALGRVRRPAAGSSASRSCSTRSPSGPGPSCSRASRRMSPSATGRSTTIGRGRQPIDTLVFSITPNPAVRLTKLKAGECHVMAFPNPGGCAADIAEDPSLTLLQQEGLNIGYMAMNTTQPALRRRRASAAP